MRSAIIVFLLGLAITSVAQEEIPVAGRVLVAQGDSSIILPDGQRVSANRRAGFSEGVILQTGPDGAMQIRLADSSLFSLSCNSLLKIKEFDTQDNSIVRLKLIQGRIRAITGTENPTSYHFETPLASLQFHLPGTDFEVLVEPGLSNIVGVYNGVLSIENDPTHRRLGVSDGFKYAILRGNFSTAFLFEPPSKIQQSQKCTTSRGII